VKKKKKRPSNPNCPVPGCETKVPHLADPIIKTLFDRFAEADKGLRWVLMGMQELRDSFRDDVERQRYFAWFTRMRQVEELYFRTLYLLFLATDREIPHILSGEPPNSFSAIYKTVNEKILEGRGEILEVKKGQSFGTFRMIDHLNSGGHANFGALHMAANFRQFPQLIPNVSGYLKHIDTYCKYIDHMRGLFEAGRDKETVRTTIVNMHRPLEHWQQQSQKQIDQAVSEETTTGGER
jgi:hypothetical protein